MDRVAPRERARSNESAHPIANLARRDPLRALRQVREVAADALEDPVKLDLIAERIWQDINSKGAA